MIIDAHTMLGHEEYLHLEADELLRRMDASGIDRAVARPMGAELVYDFPRGNDRLLRAGKRIAAMISANPWAGDAAIDEMKRCRDRGAVGLFLHPSRQGFMPIESVARPLVEAAIAWDWPVMFHTGSYTQSDILALAELARQYPHGRFVAGFGGFSDMWFELPGVLDDVPNVFVDISMNWGAATESAARRHPTRLLFASAEPRGRYGVALATVGRLDLTDDARRDILHGNARRIFKLS